MSEWKKSEIEYLKLNYETMSYRKLGEKIGRTDNAVQTKLGKLGLKRKSKYFYNKRFFEVIDTEEKAYWLGFIYADGYVVNNKTTRTYETAIQLKQSDFIHLEKFNSSLSGNIPIKKFNKQVKDKTYELCQIRLYSIDMMNDLEQHGVFQNKTFNIKFPNDLKKELYSSFIRGFFDGDGSIYYQKGKKVYRCKFTSASIDFIKSLKEIIKLNVGVDFTIINYKKHYDLLAKNQSDTFKFMNYIYYDSNIYLDKKKEIYKNILECPPYKKLYGNKFEN